MKKIIPVLLLIACFSITTNAQTRANPNSNARNRVRMETRHHVNELRRIHRMKQRHHRRHQRRIAVELNSLNTPFLSLGFYKIEGRNKQPIMG